MTGNMILPPGTTENSVDSIWMLMGASLGDNLSFIVADYTL